MTQRKEAAKCYLPPVSAPFSRGPSQLEPSPLTLRFLRIVRRVMGGAVAVSPVLLAGACACPEPAIVTVGSATLIMESQCAEVCPPSIQLEGAREPLRGCVIHPLGTAADGGAGGTRAADVDCYYVAEPGCAAGRQPPGLRAASLPIASAGTWLARVAHLERAAVHAFERLALELGAHGAPEALVGEARHAIADEVRHTELVSAEARRHGVEPPPVELADAPPRDLLAIALDNAVEGCARETYAALEMLWLSENAREPELAAIAAEIGADEARHAAFAWRLHEWLCERLGADARRRIEEVREAALRELAERLAAMPPRPERPALGLPDGPQAAALLAELQVARLQPDCFA